MRNMKEREELELILKLIRKFNLPLSPILEYAVMEKMEEYPDSGTSNIIEEYKDESSLSKEGYSIDIALEPEEDPEEAPEKKLIEESDDRMSSENYAIIDDLEIEHVYLDPKGKVVESKTSENIIQEEISTTEDRKGKPWTSNEEELVKLYFKKGLDFLKIAGLLKRTEVSIKMRLAKLGLIEYTYDKDEMNPKTKDLKEPEDNISDNFNIENNQSRSYILNNNGKKVFSDDGKFKILNNKIYVFNIKNGCFTVKEMAFDGFNWIKDKKKIVAYTGSLLYDEIVQSQDYIEIVEEIKDNGSFVDSKIKVNGAWYDYVGILVDPSDKKREAKANEDNIYPNFSVKIGDKLRLFPSHFIGYVSELLLDKKGVRKIIVKSESGRKKEIIDNKFLYEKIYEKKKVSATPQKHERPRIRYDKDDRNITYTSSRKGKLKIGDWIVWEPTNTVGKVIRFRQVGSAQKILIQSKDGRQIEVFDNPDAYSIILNK